MIHEGSDNCLSDLEASLLLKSSPTSSAGERPQSTTSSPAYNRTSTSTPSTSSGRRSDKLTRHKRFWNNIKWKTSGHFSSKTSRKQKEEHSEDKESNKKKMESKNKSDKTEVMNKDRFKRFLNLDFTKTEREAEDLESSDGIFTTPPMLEEGGAPTDGPFSTIKASFCDKALITNDKDNKTNDKDGKSKNTYCLNIYLKEGKDLVIRDRCGTSDPYVKFKVGTKLLYKSRIIEKNLNPVWDERASLRLEDLNTPVHVQVYDHDIGLMMDDFMGEAYIEPAILCLDQQVDLSLMLTEVKKSNRCSYMGHLVLQCCLTIKTQDDKEMEKSSSRYKSSSDLFRKKKRQTRATVNIVLVEGEDLKAMDDNGFSDPYVKFQLGSEKCKSKCKMKTLNPRWLESFDLDWLEGESSCLDINVFDHDVGGKDDVLGRAKFNLYSYETHVTHHLKVALEDGGGNLFVLLTICPTSPDSTQSIDSYERYDILNTFKNLKDIGEIIVTVHQARDLLAADLGGKSDPYCVVELVNTRLRTQTDFKTLHPQWGKTFVIPVTDIHSVLEVTVYDYDKNKKSEFLGKVVIPLLRINNNERRWYALKDKKLQQPSKGSIELGMCIYFNHLRAVWKTLNPREEKFLIPEATFKLATMKNNIDRVFKLIESLVKFTDFIDYCFKWENPFHSSIAFATFMVIVWTMEAYMIPIALFIIIIKNYFVLQSTGEFCKDYLPQEYCEQEKKDTETASKEEKKPQTLRERLQTIQDVCLQVQETMDAVASLVERIQNVFLWKVPWLSVLGMACLCLISCVLYLVSIRSLVMIWGVLRFARRWRAGYNVPNNELLDFLSRVPSNKELVEYREYLEIPVRS